MLDTWEMVGFALTWVFATCSFAVALLFVIKLNQARRTTKELQPFLAMAVLCLSYGVSHVIASWLDYYRWSQGIVVPGLWKAFAVILFIAGGSFVLVHEYALKKTKYIISIFVFSGIVPMLLLNDFAMENLLLLAWGIPGLLLALPLYYFIFLRPAKGLLKKRMFVTFLGMCAIGLASVLRSDSLVPILGFQGSIYAYAIGTVLDIFGMCDIGYGFSRLSTFSDLNWKTKLRELFVINDSGLCLWAFSFAQNQSIKDSDLIAGGFSGIISFLGEITKTTENLKQIDYHDLKIVLDQGKAGLITILVISDKSTYLPYKLSVFTTEFQTYFQETLAKWDGNASIFAPTAKIVEQVFELKEGMR